MEYNRDNIQYELKKDDLLTIIERSQNGDCFYAKLSYNPKQDLPYVIDVVEIKDGDWTSSHYSSDKQEIVPVSGNQERVNKGSNKIEKIRLKSDLEYYMNIRLKLEKILKGINLPACLKDHPVIVK
jgi:hypothetical protein